MKQIFLSKPAFIAFLSILSLIAAQSRVCAQSNCTQNEAFKPYAYRAPDNPPNTMPGNWSPDVSKAAQFRESAMGGRTGVLEIQSSNTNSKPYSSPGHDENLQGGIYTLVNQNVVILKADVYVSADYLNKRRRADMWGIAQGMNFTAYGELAFRNVDGKSPDFFYWDGNNNFHNANVKIIAGKWYTLEMRVNEFNIDYYINDKKVGELRTNTFISRFKNLAFHNYNFNDPALPKNQYDASSSYSSYWDNLQAICGTSCGPDRTMLYHDCMPECVKNKDVQNKLKDQNHWSQTPCPPANNPQTVSGGSMRSSEGLEPVKTLAEEVSNKLIIANYPNPFAGRTTIQYQIPEQGKVTLRVFDILGRPITTLVDGPKAQGTYKVEFNASKLSKGNYFYKIIVNTNSNKILTQTGNMNIISQ